MPELKTSILIAEDEESVRTSLAMVLSVLGHPVRFAADGLAALMEIRREIPDILLSDLNMPSMSGFELLSVVRRRYPSVRVIAMSGAFAGDQVPFGVTADAFYPKGYGIPKLVLAIGSQSVDSKPSRADSQPIWIQRDIRDLAGIEFLTIACPDCFRTFPQPISGDAGLIREIRCVFCQTPILHGMIEPFDPAQPYRFHLIPRLETTSSRDPHDQN